MQKPTSFLNSQIIDFVLSDATVQNALKARDNHPQTLGIELKCKFFKPHQTNNQKSAYTVDFIYTVQNLNLEHNDDVSVMVEVTQGNTPNFKILQIKSY